MVILVNYRVSSDTTLTSNASDSLPYVRQEDGITRKQTSNRLLLIDCSMLSVIPAYFIFWKDGLKEVKL